MRKLILMCGAVLALLICLPSIAHADVSWTPESPMALGGVTGSRPGNGTVISCATGGNCTALFDGGGDDYSATETQGSWAPAVDAGFEGITGIACTAPGSCIAVGATTLYNDSSPYEVFQVNGVWGSPQKLSVPGGIDTSLGVVPSSVSCASSAVCVAVGSAYSSSDARISTYAAGTASGLSGFSQLPGAAGSAGAVSCVPGSKTCLTAESGSQDDVQADTDGTWGSPQAVPGTGSDSYATGLSCPALNRCALAGATYPGNNTVVPFTTVQGADGSWSALQNFAIMPASAGSLSNYGAGSLSCIAPGDCLLVADLSRQPVQSLSSGGTFTAFQDQPVPDSPNIGDITPPAASCAGTRCDDAGWDTTDNSTFVPYVSSFIGTETSNIGASPGTTTTPDPGASGPSPAPAPAPAPTPAPPSTASTPSPTTPAPSTAPKPAVAAVSLAVTSTVKVVANRAKFSVRCATGACHGTVTVKRTVTVTVTVHHKRRHETRTETLGHVSYSARAGHSATVSLTLNATGRSALKAAHAHALKVTVAVTVSGGRTVSRTGVLRGG